MVCGGKIESKDVLDNESASKQTFPTTLGRSASTAAFSNQGQSPPNFLSEGKSVTNYGWYTSDTHPDSTNITTVKVNAFSVGRKRLYSERGGRVTVTNISKIAPEG